MRRSAVVMIAAVPALFAGLALAALFSVGAIAADLPAKAYSAATVPNPVLGWSGVYIQGFGFYGVNADGPSATDGSGNSVAGLASGANGPGLGVALGYNYQIGNNGVVIGARVEESWANLKQGGSINSQGLGTAVSLSNQTNYLGAFNGLVGVPITADGRAMAYAVGGLAWVGGKAGLDALFGPGGAGAAISGGANNTSVGWDIGGGIAYQLDRNWSVFGETDFYKVGDKSFTASFGGEPIATATIPYSIVISKIGFQYKIPAN